MVPEKLQSKKQIDTNLNEISCKMFYGAVFNSLFYSKLIQMILTGDKVNNK